MMTYSTLFSKKSTKKNAEIEQLSTPLSEAKIENSKLECTLQQQDQILQGNLESIKKLETDKQQVQDEIQYLSDHNYKMEQLLSHCVDDRQLFDWMTIAIRLDYIMHTKTKKNLSFDQEATYEYLKEHKIPVSSWPEKILTEISMNKQK